MTISPLNQAAFSNLSLCLWPHVPSIHYPHCKEEFLKCKLYIHCFLDKIQPCSCPPLGNPMDCSLPRLLCPWNLPGKNTEVGFHFLLLGIFPAQGSKPLLLCLLHWQEDSLPLCQAQKIQYSCIINSSLLISSHIVSLSKYWNYLQYVQFQYLQYLHGISFSMK